MIRHNPEIITWNTNGTANQIRHLLIHLKCAIKVGVKIHRLICTKIHEIWVLIIQTYRITINYYIIKGKFGKTGDNQYTEEIIGLNIGSHPGVLFVGYKIGPTCRIG